MAEYIELKAFLEKVSDSKKDNPHTDSLARKIHDHEHDHFLWMIHLEPTVDAVKVVRCKDCIGKAHWYKNDYGCTICGMSGLFVVEDNDFCSYGERRGE